MLIAAALSVRAWREASGKWHRGTAADLKRWKEAQDNALAWEQMQHDYWKDYAARCATVIETELGPETVPDPPADPDTEGEEASSGFDGRI